MKNPFLERSEHRLRALWRILIYVVLFIFFAGLSELIESDFLKYTVRAFLLFGILYVQYKYLDRRTLTDGGITFSLAWLKEFGWGSLFGLLAVGFVFLVEWSFGMLAITDFEWTRLNQNYLVIAVFLIQMLSVGFYEEAAFRGVIMKNMSEGFFFEKYGYKPAILLAVFISSSMFGLGHIGNPNADIVSTLNIVLAGVMLAVPYVLTGSLALPIGIHFAWNFSLGGIFGFNVSGLAVQHSIIHIRQTGYEAWTGGDFGPEAGILGILAMILIIMLCVFYAKRTQGNLSVHDSFSKSYGERFTLSNNDLSGKTPD